MRIAHIGRQCTVATTATADTDKVYVTLDNDPQPKERVLVQWQPRVASSGALVRVYPTRGMKGVMIPTDIGRPWLVW